MEEKQAGVDFDLKLAFAQLQSQKGTTQARHRLHDGHIAKYKKEMEEKRAVADKLRQLPRGSKTWEKIGDIYVLKPVEQVLEGFAREEGRSRREVKVQEKKKALLDLRLRESEKELRRLVNLKKNETV